MYTSSGPAIGREQHAGWGFQILPYVEAVNVWESDPLTAISTPNQIFFCPSRRGPQTVEDEDNYFPRFNLPSVTRALCDYAGGNRDGTGPLQQYDPVSFSDVSDGTSNTLMLGDKRLNVRALGQSQDDDNEGYTAGFNEDTIRRTDRPPAADYSDDQGDGDKLFGSSHPSTLNIGLADGSVRSLPYTIDGDIFDILGNRADGEVLELD